MTALARVVERIDSATPRDRDRALDGLRALALAGVVVGHWMVGALVLDGDGSDGAGGLAIASPLAEMGWLAPASWVLQMLGLFFLVGGRVAALGWTRTLDRSPAAAAESGSVTPLATTSDLYRRWWRARWTRLTRPVLAVVVTGAVVLPLLSVAGVPDRTLLSAVTLVLQPLWFVGVYLVLTGLTWVLVAADRRWRLWACAPGVLLVAAVDLARYGPWADQVPSGIGWLTVLPGFGIGYQLGIAWAAGRLDSRRVGWLLAAAGAVLFTALVTVAGYPSSMVGVPGEVRGNAHPPSLLVVALAATQCGLAVLAREHVARLLRNRVLWAGAVLVNLSALSILCWHQVASLLPSTVVAQAGWVVPGLTDAPGSPGWLLARLAWLPLLTLLLVAICRLARPFESGRPVDAGHLLRRVHPGASGPSAPRAASPAAPAPAARPPTR